ncbi:MAG: SEL1-like repeat protein [Legionellaceae bacterium]|nr:SEL1-like repeat protein [Legionellaceae bacterium]
MLVLDILKQIRELTKAIDAQLKRYHNNPPKLKTLASLVKKTVVKSQALATFKNREQYKDTLIELQEYLIQTQQFVQVFMDVLSNQSWWGMLVNFWNARTYDTRIDSLKEKLLELRNDLHFDLSAQAIDNQEREDDVAQQRLEEKASLKWSVAHKEQSITISHNGHSPSLPESELTQMIAFLEGRTMSAITTRAISPVTEELMPAGKRAQGSNRTALVYTRRSARPSSDEWISEGNTAVVTTMEQLSLDSRMGDRVVVDTETPTEQEQRIMLSRAWTRFIMRLRAAIRTCTIPAVSNLAITQLSWISKLDLAAQPLNKQKTVLAFLKALVAFTETTNDTNYFELLSRYPTVSLDPQDLEAVKRELPASSDSAFGLLNQKARSSRPQYEHIPSPPTKRTDYSAQNTFLRASESPIAEERMPVRKSAPVVSKKAVFANTQRSSQLSSDEVASEMDRMERSLSAEHLIIRLKAAIRACAIPAVKKLATTEFSWLRTFDFAAQPLSKQKTAIAFLTALVAYTESTNKANYSELHRLYLDARLNPKDLEAVQQDLTASIRLAFNALRPQHSSSTLKINSDRSSSNTIKPSRGRSTHLRATESLLNIGLYKIQGSNGYRVSKNEGIADLTRAATEDNDPSAMYNLGVAFEKGYTDDGIPDLHLALNYYTQAAEADPRDKMAKQKIALMRRMIAAVSDDGLEVDLGQGNLSFSV